MVNRYAAIPLAAVSLSMSLQLFAAEGGNPSEAARNKPEEPKAVAFAPELQVTKGTVTVGGKRVEYAAHAGTLVVHLKDYDDVAQNANKDEKVGPAEASMFYVAYFKSDGPGAQRPLTFLFNGGPGSPTVWLHMGAFGPRRVVTSDDTHTPAAPYSLVNNEFSLLDASDLVFIDAPATGFSRVAGKDHEKAFFGVDADAQAFADFIGQFLSKYGRWNSPKYLFGESYGTTRAAVLIHLLESNRAVDFNGVILLSQILSFDNSPDGVELNPGVDQAYALALPTYSATAWYHHKLPGPVKSLETLMGEVEQFAMTDYMTALLAGATLDSQRRDAVAAKLHEYTGLPESYILKANLRVDGGEFSKALQDDSTTTTGRIDTRFSGPSMDPLSKEAGYDPFLAAVGSAYVSGFNEYVRKDLQFGENRSYRPLSGLWMKWNFAHQPPGAPFALIQSTNVMPDLAAAMKLNPQLKIMVNGGYFDLATPFFEAIYEMQHLAIPASLQKNIEFKFYESGHMVYAHPAALKTLHDNVAEFIQRTNNVAIAH